MFCLPRRIMRLRRHVEQPLTRPCRYRAFLSYSHRDKAWADWIHAALEGFRLGDELIGRETSAGIVPPTLRPVFRDRDDFSAGPSLVSQSLEALEASHSMVVLCSPRAAQSPYVNEEIRIFKALGRSARVFAIIVDGEPGDATRECFPPALRFAVGADGALTGERLEPIAADARPQGDGKRLALVKIVAGITGLPYDDIRKREVMAHRRARLIRSTVGASLAVLAMAAGLFGYQSWRKDEQVQRQQVQLDQTKSLVSMLIGTAQAQGVTLSPDQQQALSGAITATAAAAAAGDARSQQALDLLAQGKQAEATALLQAIARDKEAQSIAKAAQAKKDALEAAAAYRNLGSIAGLADPKTAREAYRKAIELDPEDMASLQAYAYLMHNAGNLAVAETSARALIRLAEAATHAGRLAAGYTLMGDIFSDQGKLANAFTSYSAAMALLVRLAGNAPKDLNRQHDIAVLYLKLGDALSEQGKSPSALESFQAAQAEMSRLLAIKPDNITWQRELSVSHNRMGDVLRDQGKMDAALESYRTAHVIAARLAGAEPKNAERQRDWSISHNKMGDLLKEKGDLATALPHFQAALAISGKLVSSDPANANWQRDLSITYNKIGDTERKQNNLTAALENFRSALAIRERLTKSDPRNLSWQRDLSISHENIGECLRDRQDFPAALSSFQASLAIAEMLGKADPANAVWQRDIAISHERIGDILLRLDNSAAALASLTTALAVYDRLAEATTEDGKARLLSVVPRVRLATLDPANARRHLTTALDILKPLADAGRLDSTRLGWIPRLEADLAKLPP